MTNDQVHTSTFMTRVGRQLLRGIGHLSFLRHGIRYRFIEIFHHPGNAVNEEFIVPFYGRLYRGNFNTLIDWSVFYYGAYGKTELDLIRDILAFIPKPRFLDIGGNIGHHTLFASIYSDEVITVEPFQQVSKKIVQKINDNHLENVRLLDYALGNTNGIAEYYPPDTTNTGTGSFIGSGQSVEPIKLKMIKADDLFLQENILPVSFIKMDAEGYEVHILEGMMKVLEEQRPVVFFEWTPDEEKEKSSESNRNLFPEGYLFFQFSDRKIFLFVFEGAGYKLKHVDGNWDPGMILALPEEFLKKDGFAKYLAKRTS